MGSRSINYGVMSCSVTTSSKDSSGNFTISAYFKNNTTVSTINVRLSCSMTDSSPWSRISVGTVSAGSSASGSITMSSGNTSDDVVYCYLIYGTSATTGQGGSVSVDGYVDPTPPTPSMSTPTLSISPTTANIGEAIAIKLSGGSGYSVSSAPITVNGSTVTDFKSYIGKNWTIPVATFEPLFTSTSLSAIFKVNCTAASGYQGSGTTNSVTVTMKLPSTYYSTADANVEYINPRNDALVADISSIKLTLSPYVMPSDSSAKISSVVLSGVETTGNISTSNFTQSGYTWASTTLPTTPNQASYTFTPVFTITDSRGTQSTYKPGTYKVTNFVPPKVTINNLNRTSGTTASLDLTITGESSDKPTIVNEATLQIGEEDVIDVSSLLIQSSATYGYTFNYELSGLNAGSQYTITFNYQDKTMASYGVGAYSYTKILSTQSLPLSLYDDHSRMAISFGEECADDYGEDMVINFAKDSFIRYMNDNEEVLLKVAEAFRQCPYNVGDIYITTLSTDPSTIWPNTSWEQLEDAFLYASGTHALGDTGGEETHTLTVEEMPAHTHSYVWKTDELSCDEQTDQHYVGSNNTQTGTTGSTGGGQAHNNMPPYLVVNMWKRIETIITYQFTVSGYGTYSYDGPSTWSAFVSSDKNPVLSGSDKVFKVESNKSYGNVIAIGRLVSSVATYDKYLYNSKNALVKATSRISNDATYTPDIIDFDYITSTEYSEIDIIQTTDIHGCWLGYQTSPRLGDGYATNFAYSNSAYSNVLSYKNRLESSGTIKALCVDCGDWSHYTADGRTINTNYGQDAIDEMNSVGYFAVTLGNHEYKTDLSTSFISQKVSQIKGTYGTACNITDKSTGELIMPAYRTAKIGTKKLAIIGVAFSGADGDTTAWNNAYTFVDGTDLYNLIQTYIDKFTALNFDYIGVIAHLGEGADGSGRSTASCTAIIQNTSGLDFICAGHSHAEIKTGFTVNDKSGNAVHFAAQPMCDFAYMTRIQITSSGITSAVLTSY